MDKEVEEIYQTFWKDIVEKDGVVDMDEVKKELYDYHFLLENVSKVYCYVTDNNISKPNTYASSVISEYERSIENMKEEWEKDLLEDEDMLREYFAKYRKNKIKNILNDDQDI